MVKNFLMDSNFDFVGIEVADDIAKLKDEYGLECITSADIREQVFGAWFKISCVGSGVSNWGGKSVEQRIGYGCIDAYVSYKIGHKLSMDA